MKTKKTSQRPRGTSPASGKSALAGAGKPKPGIKAKSGDKATPKSKASQGRAVAGKATPARSRKVGSSDRPAAVVKAVPKSSRKAAADKKLPVASRKVASADKAAARRQRGKTAQSAVRVRAKSVAAQSSKAAGKSPARARPVVGDTSATAERIEARRLTASQKREFKALLLAMRERLDSSISAIKSESLATSDWINVEEDGTDIFDQQFALNIVSSENEMLIRIDEALARIESAEYGMCDECGSPIHIARLKALPFARNCVVCQAQKENGNSQRARILDVLE